VLHAYAPSETFLVGCSSGFGQRRRLYLSTPAKQLRLGYEVAAFESDGRYPGGARQLVLNPGNESILVDMATGATTKLEEGTSMIASPGDSVLMARKERLYWLSADGSERDLVTRRPPLARVLHSGAYVTVGSLWFDGSRASKPIALDGEPLALSRDGRVLLSDRRPASEPAGLPQGPLRWIDPAVALDPGASPR
jgi:hypothetical protein